MKCVDWLVDVAAHFCTTTRCMRWPGWSAAPLLSTWRSSLSIRSSSSRRSKNLSKVYTTRGNMWKCVPGQAGQNYAKFYYFGADNPAKYAMPPRETIELTILYSGENMKALHFPMEAIYNTIWSRLKKLLSKNLKYYLEQTQGIVIRCRQAEMLSNILKQKHAKLLSEGVIWNNSWCRHSEIFSCVVRWKCFL